MCLVFAATVSLVPVLDIMLSYTRITRKFVWGHGQSSVAPCTFLGVGGGDKLRVRFYSFADYSLYIYITADYSFVKTWKLLLVVSSN